MVNTWRDEWRYQVDGSRVLGGIEIKDNTKNNIPREHINHKRECFNVDFMGRREDK